MESRHLHLHHHELKEVIRQYADDLRRPESQKARKAFRDKMDFICGVEKQPPQDSQVANPDGASER
jgi:hypothetical protein